jgi:glucosamine kinase
MAKSGNHIIGVDGGGSTCRVAIAGADGTVIGSATGAAANPATSMSQAIATLTATLEEARIDAGLSADAIADAHAHLGLAGAINARIAQAVTRALPIRRAVVTDDRPTNIAGALGEHDGFLAAIGTGSFIGSQRGRDQRFVGGWGLRLGDQASGAWLGLRLLSCVLEAEDGLRPSSGLLDDTLAAFDGDPSAIAVFGVTAAPPDFAAYAPKVVAAATAGDAAALAIIAEGVAYVEHALRTLGFVAGDTLCLGGGLGPHYADFLSPGFTGNLIRPAGSALDGALRLAAGQVRAK